MSAAAVVLAIVLGAPVILFLWALIEREESDIK